jgi:hypothetical protein
MQFDENKINGLTTQDLIEFAEKNNMEPILERYKAHVEKNIQRMNIDINELKDEALK